MCILEFRPDGLTRLKDSWSPTGPALCSLWAPAALRLLTFLLLVQLKVRSSSCSPWVTVARVGWTAVTGRHPAHLLTTSVCIAKWRTGPSSCEWLSSRSYTSPNRVQTHCLSAGPQWLRQCGRTICKQQNASLFNDSENTDLISKWMKLNGFVETHFCPQWQSSSNLTAQSNPLYLQVFSFPDATASTSAACRRRINACLCATTWWRTSFRSRTTVWTEVLVGDRHTHTHTFRLLAHRPITLWPFDLPQVNTPWSHVRAKWSTSSVVRTFLSSAIN